MKDRSSSQRAARAGLDRRAFIGHAAASGAALSLSPAIVGRATARAEDASALAFPHRELPTGRQHMIERGDQRAVITEVGATLRSYKVGGREFLDTFGRFEYATAQARGQVLIPWPSRIENGRYEFGEVVHQLPINEVANNNALQGLTRWVNWEKVEEQSDATRVTLSVVLHPQPGYPFTLFVVIEYALKAGGLRVTTVAKNVGLEALPFGAGHHPYLTVGTPLIDDAFLRIPARTVQINNDRFIPIGSQPVAGTEFDFRRLRRIGTTKLHTVYTDLIRDDFGFARVRMEAPGGRPHIVLWMDGNHDFIQLFTGDVFRTRAREGLEVQPMTCGPNAFNNDMGLKVLQPTETFTSMWGMTATP